MSLTDGSPINLLNVYLMNLGTGEQMTVKTDPNGNYTFSNLGAGTYMIQLCAW